MVGEIQKRQESVRLDFRKVRSTILCLFHAVAHHSVKDRRGLSDHLLVDLEDLLLGTDSKGEELVIVTKHYC